MSEIGVIASLNLACVVFQVREDSPILDFTIQDGNSAFQLFYDTVLSAAIDSNRRGNNMMYKKGGKYLMRTWKLVIICDKASDPSISDPLIFCLSACFGFPVSSSAVSF